MLVDCVAEGEYGCQGGSVLGALHWVRSSGVPTEESYPYKAEEETCHLFDAVYRFRNIGIVMSTDPEQMKMAVLQ